MNETPKQSFSFRNIALLCVVLVMGAFVFRWVVQEQFSNAHNFSDFPAYQFAAHVLRTGGDPFDIQEVSLAAAQEDAQLSTIVAPYRHSVVELLPFVAFDHLSYSHARQVWMFGVAVSALAIAWILWRYFSPWPRNDPRSWILVLVPFLFVPFIYSVELHQTNTWLLLFLLLGILCVRKKWIVAASIFFGAAIVGKFFLAALILVLLVQKKYTLVLLTVFVAAILFFAPFALYPKTFFSYTHTVVPELFSSNIHDNPLNPVPGSGSIAWWKNVSLAGVGYRMFTAQQVVRPIAEIPLVPIIRVVGYIIFAATCFLLWKFREWIRAHEEHGFLFGFSGLLLAWFIASSFTWQHHLIFLLLALPALPYVFAHSETKRAWAVCGVIAILGINILAAPPAHAPIWLQQVYVAIPALALLLGWIASAGMLWRKRT
ncbi:MAG: glycosyltransferase 87 family protein [Patescibacteria group bacterium]|jgi:hypothetical protein